VAQVLGKTSSNYLLCNHRSKWIEGTISGELAPYTHEPQNPKSTKSQGEPAHVANMQITWHKKEKSEMPTPRKENQHNKNNTRQSAIRNKAPRRAYIYPYP